MQPDTAQFFDKHGEPGNADWERDLADGKRD
jgi:hypothetical protein